MWSQSIVPCIILVFIGALQGQEICPPTPGCDITEAGKLKSFPPDCTRYIYCNIQGKAEISKCPEVPEILHFSEEFNTCVDPALANCSLCQYAQPTLAYCPKVEACTNETIGARHAYPSDCTKYIYCDEYSIEHLSDCPMGDHFSSYYTTCTEPSLANCPICDSTDEDLEMESTSPLYSLPSCPPPEDCTIDDYGKKLPYYEDCTKFIYCDIYGNNVVTECPENQHFSAQVLDCLPIDQAGCVECAP